MEKILITGQGGSGKTLVASGLGREYEVKGYIYICLENIEPGKEIELQIAEAIDKGRDILHFPEGSTTGVAKRRIISRVSNGDFEYVDFCVLTSLEPPEEFDVDFFRVIRTGRS